MKRQVLEWEMVTNHIFDKALIPGIYNEHIKLSKKKMNYFI